jgi:GntR family transcriptional regulator
VTIRPGEPLSVQLANAIRDAILAGTYGPGDALPSERQLAEQHGVSGGTVRAALARLAGEGLISTRHGRGVFVREQATRRKVGDDLSWRAILARYGKADASVVEVRREPCPDDAAERLGVEAGTEVTVRDRLLRAEGEPPAMISLSWHPAWIMDLLPELADPAKGGMKGMHEALGLRLYFVDVFSSRRPTEAERARLELEPGDVVTEQRGTTFDQDHRPLYAIHHVAAGHRIEFAIRYGDLPDSD